VIYSLSTKQFQKDKCFIALSYSSSSYSLKALY